MTNEEKTENIISKYETKYNDTSDLLWTDIEDVAMEMAEWKDEQHAKEKQQWIEKACEWLKNNIHDYYVTGEFEQWFDEMFEDFRKAMKGE